MNTPILVTGSHRSGATWAGKSLALALNTGYIHEPFNIEIRCGVIAEPFNNFFQFIHKDNSNKYKEILRKVIHFEYPFIANLARARNIRNYAKIARDQTLFKLHQIKKDRPIVKEGIAIFSAEWLSLTFEMDVLVMIRHPAAFCSSYLRPRL